MELNSALLSINKNIIRKMWIFITSTLTDILFYIIQFNCILLSLLIAFIIGSNNNLSNGQIICLDFKKKELNNCKIEKFTKEPYKQRGQRLRYLTKTSCSDSTMYLPVFTEGFSLTIGDTLSKIKNESFFTTSSNGTSIKYYFENVFLPQKLTITEKIDGTLKYFLKIIRYSLIFGFLIYLQISTIKKTYTEKL